MALNQAIVSQKPQLEWCLTTLMLRFWPTLMFLSRATQHWTCPSHLIPLLWKSSGERAKVLVKLMIKIRLWKVNKRILLFHLCTNSMRSTRAFDCINWCFALLVIKVYSFIWNTLFCLQSFHLSLLHWHSRHTDVNTDWGSFPLWWFFLVVVGVFFPFFFGCIVTGTWLAYFAELLLKIICNCQVHVSNATALCINAQNYINPWTSLLDDAIPQKNKYLSMPLPNKRS